jgi:hypothetical protein
MFDPKLQYQLHKELLDNSLVRKLSNFTSKKNIRLKTQGTGNCATLGVLQHSPGASQGKFNYAI